MIVSGQFVGLSVSQFSKEKIVALVQSATDDLLYKKQHVDPAVNAYIQRYINLQETRIEPISLMQYALLITFEHLPPGTYRPQIMQELLGSRFPISVPKGVFAI